MMQEMISTPYEFKAFCMFYMALFMVINIHATTKIMLRRFGKRLFFFSFIVLLLQFTLMELLALMTSYRISGKTMGPILTGFSKLPVWVVIICFIVDFFLILFLMNKVRISQKTKISSKSIKEAIDKLPTGLFFYNVSGHSIMINAKMKELGYKLSGKTISNGNEFFNAITGSKSINNGITASSYNTFVIKMRDSSVWSFERHLIKFKESYVYELVATNVTSEYELHEELNNDYKTLKNYNSELKKFSKTVVETTREREILETKIRVHDTLGELLLKAKKASNEDSKEDTLSLLNTWFQTVTMLKASESNDDDDKVTELVKAGKNIGVNVIIETEIPNNKIFHIAIHECLTNTVKHAHGDTLKVKVTKYKERYLFEASNNGDMPEGRIIEKGGLLSLRKLVEDSEGFMEIEVSDIFTLKIELYLGGDSKDE